MTDEVTVLYRKNQPVERKMSKYPGFKQETVVLPNGYKKNKSSAALECNIIFERDVAVKLRDGTTIYTDILRPDTGAKVPAIVAWSPYGKNGAGPFGLSLFPGKLGIKGLSNLQKWEGPDPAYWCKHGYAVCHPDTRGAFKSEGDITYWGTQDGRDGCDYVEWITQQEWCNGKVGLTGNSWLAISQWYIAAEQPNGLAAIAPWEGHSDLYRDDVVRGGIPNTGFNEFVNRLLFGSDRIEDLTAMVQKYPLVNSFWEDRRAAFEKIKTPAYIVGSYSNGVHTQGTFRAWESIASKEKWFRIHNEMEWTDYYKTDSTEDLRKFFDHYLKGRENGWENTPRIRASILDANGEDVVNRALDTFPPVTSEKKIWYLRADQKLLSENPAAQMSNITYRSDNKKDKVSFTCQFDRDAALLGYGTLKLWVEALESDDTDVYVQVEIIGTNGKVQKSTVVKPDSKALASLYKIIPMNAMHYSGPGAKLRASLRHVDEEKSTEREAYHTFDRVEKLKKGEAVPLLFNLGPVGMTIHRGETLKLTVAGYDLAGGLMPGMKAPESVSKGTVSIQTGGNYDSYLSFHVVDSENYIK